MAEGGLPTAAQYNKFSFNDNVLSINNPIPPMTSEDSHHELTASPPDSADHANETTATSGVGETPPDGTKPQTDAHGRALNPRSCVTCRRRKVRCDKTHPCANCARAHIECIFPAPGRAPRKARKLGDGRDKELLERLRRLEGVVKGMGVTVPDHLLEAHSRISADRGRHPTSANSETPEEYHTAHQHRDDSSSVSSSAVRADDSANSLIENKFGRLVINEGKSRYVNNTFWASLSNEVEDLKGILNQVSDDEDAPSPETGLQFSGGHNGFVFAFSSQNVDMLPLHPPSSRIPAYWQVYKENVDPLVKVLHIPSLEPTILGASSQLSTLPKGFEALLFAIYYGAVTSASAEDCLAQFGEDRSILLTRYRFAIEQALARSNFLTTAELVVIQAFIIFLICLRRNSHARVIWTLTGLVVRIAQTLGLHRDGGHFGLKVFDVEMRRRAWWQVCILDTRSSEDYGCDPTITEQSFDTKLPLNINDTDISPEMTTFPPERQGCTDMSFCLIRCEVVNTFRRINYSPPGVPKAHADHWTTATLADKEQWITDCHNKLEEKYLKHCDMNVPLFWVTATVARLIMSKMWLIVYHPFQRQDGGASLSEETREKLFITSLEMAEYSVLLETETRTKKWGWLFRTYMQWHALAFLLSELCHRTKGDLVERAWVAMEKTREGRWGDVVSDDNSANTLWRPLKKLYLKALAARTRGLQEEQLEKQRATGAPTRTYSPNANPMFGHPKRPHMTRAPLSQAQLQRFTQGPVYGHQPLDPTELLGSPRGSETSRDHENDVSATTGSSPFDFNQPTHSKTFPLQQWGSQTFNAQHFDSSAPLLDLTAQMDFKNLALPLVNNGISAGASIAGTTNTANTAMTSHTGMAAPLPTSGPIRSNSNTSSLDGLMDTSGDLNWENWDQLVRQFGMDIDQPPGESDVGAGVWNGPGWDMLGSAQGQQNMRMGMGSSDWF